MTLVATFEITSSGYLDPAGEPTQPVPEAFATRAVLLHLYQQMVLARQFDTRAVALQRTGRLGTYASSLGQEAVGVGVAHAMTAQDVLLPSFREHALQLCRGVAPEQILQFWGGDERGSNFSAAGDDFPVCITVGGHAPQAAGVALAFKLRKEPRVAVCVLGDGATSKGDFYEALNVAGVWQLPLVFVVVNNGWAISMPSARQTACATLAQKAVAGGFSGEQVDGNDVIAVAAVTGAAIDAARSGAGPRLIECLTYRLADHTTADDASRYRSAEQVAEARLKDPLTRLRAHLKAHHDFTAVEDDGIAQAAAATIEAATTAYLDLPAEPPVAMFDNLYERLPDALIPQRDALLARTATVPEDV